MIRASTYRMFVNGMEIKDYKITEVGPGTVRMNLKLPEGGIPDLTIGSDITLKHEYLLGLRSKELRLQVIGFHYLSDSRYADIECFLKI